MMEKQIAEARKPFLREEVNSLLTSLGEGLVVSDDRDKVIFMNPAAEKILTVKEDEFLGKPIWACHKNVPVVEAAIAASHKGPVVREAKCVELGKTFRVHISSVRGPDASFKGSAMLVQDVTRERELQKELMESNRELRRRQEKLDLQLRMALEVQKALLPADMHTEDFSFRGKVMQASEVGGDFYMYTPLDGDRVFLALGDVVGKGVPAALIMTFVINSLTVSAKDLGKPCKVLEDINRKIIETMGQELHAGVSLFVLVLDGRTGEVEFAGAACEPPMWLKANGECDLLKTEGFALGTFPDNAYKVSSITMGKEDRLVIFTDGIVDARNGKGEFLGDRRWYALVNRNAHLRGNEFLEALFDEMKEFGAGTPQTDDIAILILEKH